MLVETLPNQDYQEADLVTYFQTLQMGFQRAASAAGVIEQFYNIGGHTICLQFAGAALISQVTPAIAHLKTSPTDNPALTVCLWDSESTHTPLPLMATSLIELIQRNCWDYLDTRMEIKGYNSDRFYSIFHLGSNLLSTLDKRENIALYWTGGKQALPYWENGSPLRNILNWWMSDRNLQYVHAGAVGNRNGGVLLAGKGGSGKSSTALACLDSELVYASDDYCLVETSPAPCVYSLYNTAKLKGKEDLERFPHLAPLISNPKSFANEKAMIFLHQHYPDKLVNQLPIKAILVPKVTGLRDTQITKASSMLALKALAPSTIFQLPNTGQNALKTMATLARQVPCYSLELGTDILQIPRAIAALLSQL